MREKQEQDLTQKRLCALMLLRYAEAFGTTRQNAYQRMKEAEDSLFNRRFSFYDDDGKLVKSRWIQQVKYLDDEGAIELVLLWQLFKELAELMV